LLADILEQLIGPIFKGQEDLCNWDCVKSQKSADPTTRVGTLIVATIYLQLIQN